MKNIEIGSGKAALRYLEFKGEGRPLLMIHGLGCSGSFEFPHVARAPALAARHVIILDLFGFGYSDRPKGFGYRVSDHGEVVADCVRKLNLGPIDLYGHSMGGPLQSKRQYGWAPMCAI